MLCRGSQCILPLLILFPTLKINVIQIYILAVCTLKKKWSKMICQIIFELYVLSNAFDNLLKISRSFQMKTKSIILIKMCTYFFSTSSQIIKPGLSVNWLINLKRLKSKRFKYTFRSYYNWICFHQNKDIRDTDINGRDVILDWMQ